MKLNICMLHGSHFKPDALVYPQEGVCSYLGNFGHNVTWVIWAKEGLQFHSFSFNDIRVYATPRVKYLPGSSLLIRILNMIPNSLRRIPVILKIIKEGKYDLVFVIDGVLDGLVAAYIRRRHKVAFIFALSNPLEQQWETIVINRRRPIFLFYLAAKLNTFITRRLLHGADLILPISKALKWHLVEQGIPESKIMPYPSGADMDSFSSRDGATIRRKHNLDDFKIIIYIGRMTRPRYLSVLIQALAKVKKERQNVKLLMVGDGNDKENLSRLATELGAEDDVVFVGTIPQSEVSEFIAAADIAVSPVQPLSFYKLSSPIKLFEYMAMSKPVVANEEIAEHKEVVEESGGGILVSFTPEALAGAIIELLDDPERATEMGRRGREWVLRNRTYEILARQLEQRFIDLIQRKGSR